MSGNARKNDLVTVHVPVELPVLTTRGWRILLEILTELTTVEVLDGPSGEGCRDC
ncbi:hypothetical protein EV192_103651 [Actinocrispum wychmicini]|uniref:Uncharacterized protein n=1 Tax=Actinocrispum wychmicini TaxID=1213861 RepID=A0A4R2JPY7_9PSEU|nr:hypothetical protein EV192_103651 [Actinocrispum wychmicini]